jgi:hypothetical protein
VSHIPDEASFALFPGHLVNDNTMSHGLQEIQCGFEQLPGFWQFGTAPHSSCLQNRSPFAKNTSRESLFVRLQGQTGKARIAHNHDAAFESGRTREPAPLTFQASTVWSWSWPNKNVLCVCFTLGLRFCKQLSTPSSAAAIDADAYFHASVGHVCMQSCPRHPLHEVDFVHCAWSLLRGISSSQSSSGRPSARTVPSLGF